MGAEHAGSDDEAADIPVTPLSFFFPGVTEEESKTLDPETALICERRMRVMAMYEMEMTMRQIAAELKCSLGTVHNDIHTVLDSWARIAANSAKKHIAKQLMRISFLESQVMIDLLQSRGEHVEVTAGKRGGKGDGDDGLNTTVKKKMKYGDPKLHALLRGYCRDRSELLGLLRDMGGATAEPTIKYIVGLDPLDLLPRDQ